MPIRSLLFTLTVISVAFTHGQDTSFVKHDTIRYNECGMFFQVTGEGQRDTIAQIKHINYPSFSTDTSDILQKANNDVEQWVLNASEGMDAPCDQNLRAFAGKYGHGGPFIIFVEHNVGINKNGLFSVQLISNKEPCCGISGLTNTTRSWNLDLRKGRELTINDVVLPEKKKAFFKLIDKKEIKQSLYPDSAGVERAFDFLIEQERIRVFFHEQWGGMKYYVEVSLRYLEHQQLFQHEFLDRIELKCRVREDIIPGRRIYSMVEVPPSYPGGQEALMGLIRRELSYTDMFTSPNTYVSFVVESNGWITNPTVIKASSETARKEALRFLKRMDRWIPGTCNGKEVPVLFSMPVKAGD